jgi:thiol-disulfide isomerase/thioredoxin
MELLKRGLALALAALLTLPLCLGTSAEGTPDVGLSTQALQVNGDAVSAQAYNIGGANYFKLRDIACALDGTEAQFNVRYDEQANAVRIATGEPYQKIGGELDKGEDLSSTAVRSAQTVYIDGKKNTELDAYNIGGANYFKLRDLGNALRFDVDYDESTRTMLVTTAPANTEWAPDIVFTTVDTNGNTWTDACFAEHKLTIINLWAYWCGPCVSELPDMQKLWEEYADKGVQFLGISDEEDEADNIKMMQRKGITYPCLRYTDDFDAYLNTGYIPVTIFVDSNGKVLGEAHIGSMSYKQWRGLINKYLPKS